MKPRSRVLRRALFRSLGLCGVLVVASSSPSCSLIADASDIDQACEAGFKYCKDVEACVSYSDPGFGCALTSCEPCSATSSNQVMGCVRGRCEVVACTTQGDCRQGM